MPHDPELLRLAADITVAHVSHNTVTEDELPDLLRAVYTALSDAGTETPLTDQLRPAVPVKKSVFPGHIICLEDGQKLRTLKRHLHTSHGLTPDAYRERWGLPGNYPMVAPDYAASRSAEAVRRRLGHKSVASKEPSSPPVLNVLKSRQGKAMNGGEVTEQVGDD